MRGGISIVVGGGLGHEEGRDGDVDAMWRWN